MTDFATGEPYNQYLVFVIEQQYLLAAYEYTWRAMWLLWHIMWQKWRHSQSQKSEEDWGTAIIDMHRKFDEVLTCCFQDIWVVRQPDALITILCTVFHPPLPPEYTPRITPWTGRQMLPPGSWFRLYERRDRRTDGPWDWRDTASV